MTDTPKSTWFKKAGVYGLLFLACAYSVSPGVLTEWGTLSRNGLFTGEWWRLLTHFFIHLDSAHLAVNLAGAGCLVVLWPSVSNLPATKVAILGFGTALGTALMHEGEVYGLSGLLHAYFGYFAMSQGFPDRGGRATYRLVLASGLAIKVFLESLGFVSAGVAWKAHLAGAAIGLCLAVAEHLSALIPSKNVPKQASA
ncbi:rhomboid family intramembrane serine protease [Nostoc sp. CHAB 5834]|nr:rhomboid family intramembrane serine protease [Nostoc sp. CHAB 5834]